jgi:SAM-dependent methyltransferase
MNKNIDNPQHLRTTQYKDATNLNARIALHTDFSTNPQDLMVWLYEQIQLPEQARVFEVGCGPGTLWRLVVDRIPPGWQLTLSDLSPGMLATARDHLGAARFAFLSADACALPLPTQGFDAVCAHFMLYHVPDRARAIAELKRMLVPDGCLYTATIGKQHMHELYLLVNEFLGDRGQMEDVHAALEFTLEDGQPQLQSHFDLVEMRLFEDAIIVDQVAPLVAYIQSLPTRQQNSLRDELALELTEFITAYIQAHGPVRLTKRIGLFIAR